MKNRFIVVGLIVIAMLTGCGVKEVKNNEEIQSMEVENQDKDKDTENQNDTTTINNNIKDISSISQDSNSIGIAQAIHLIEEKYGKSGRIDKESKNIIQYEAIDVREIDGEDYYNFEYQLVDTETKNISVAGHILVSVNGDKTYFVNESDEEWDFYNISDTVLTFGCETENGNIATLVLGEDLTFQFMSEYGNQSGNFNRENDKIVCYTFNHEYNYIFDIVDDYTISFNTNESQIDSKIYENFPNGTIFSASQD